MDGSYIFFLVGSAGKEEKEDHPPIRKVAGLAPEKSSEKDRSLSPQLSDFSDSEFLPRRLMTKAQFKEEVKDCLTSRQQLMLVGNIS